MIGFILIPAVVGCGDSGPEEITGTVTFQGQLIESGRIVYVSIDEKNAPTSSGNITKGAYKVTGRGGVLPGRYRVQITIYEPRQQQEGLAMDQLPISKPIGTSFYVGQESPLTADITSDKVIYRPIADRPIPDVLLANSRRATWFGNLRRIGCRRRRGFLSFAFFPAK